jgi:hypothetical protein
MLREPAAAWLSKRLPEAYRLPGWVPTVAAPFLILAASVVAVSPAFMQGARNAAIDRQFGGLSFDAARSRGWVDAMISAGAWARDNTAEQSLFLVPPEAEKFRLYAERALYYVPKDRSLSVLDRDFAGTWRERERRVKAAYESISSSPKAFDAFLAFASSVEADYALVPPEAAPRRLQLYANDHIAIVRIGK